MTALLPLQVTGASVQRRGHVLIQDIDFTLSEGRGLTVVIGPNGAGKTTLLRMLHGLEKIRHGAIEWACDLAQARARQAFVFQTPVMMRRSVRQNLEYPLQLRGVEKQESRRRATDWINEIGLTGKEELFAPSLSGGEKQKLALARALITKPDVLFLDEPCSSLDGAATREIERLLHGAVEKGTRVVMSSHDLGQAQRLADDVVFMVKGRIYENLPASEFFASPQTGAGRAFLNGDIVE